MSVTCETQKTRRLLSFPGSQSPDAAAALLRRAIAMRTCVIGDYNKGRVKLAPYVLYERDDVLFVDAVTVERDGKAPREPKLGAFRISGLNALSPTVEPFEPELEVPVADERRYAGGIRARL